MTAGQLGQFLIYALLVATSAASLTEMWGEVQRAAGAMERLAELLAAEPGDRRADRTAGAARARARRCAFEHVWFRYPSRPETPGAVGSVRSTVHSGETVAIVGPSGAGKSTSFQLLLRFYDPERGRICIDGHRSSQPATRRSCAGRSDSCRRTRCCSAPARARTSATDGPGSSDAQIEAAARAAAADEFLRALPAGYDTFLGERGTRLSGGQRQRIAIARAILKDPPILLLDEATSALDAESERLVQAALAELMRGRTTLVIAHRLATVLKADRIVVLEAGRLVAIGTHARAAA